MRPSQGAQPSSLPLVQFTSREGVIDLAWGHPDPELLPRDALAAATVRVIDKFGADSLGYGAAMGPGPLIDWLTVHLATTDARAPSPDELLITPGTSYALSLLVTLLAEPGGAVLVGVPTYHLALRIFADHPVQVVPVPSDEHGICVDELTATIGRLRKEGIATPLLYTIPTFANPTGLSFAAERRGTLVQAMGEAEVLIVEDDVYRELNYDGQSPASLWSERSAGEVCRLGSFAKTVAPGLRVGFMTAPSSLIDRVADSGVLDSGGGAAHFSGLVVAEFARSGDYQRHVQTTRDSYGSRRDAMMLALEAYMPDGVTWTRPAGGYFVWVELPSGFRPRQLLPEALRRGVGYLAGEGCYTDPAEGGRFIRLAFSRYDTASIAEGVRRLGLLLADS